MSVQQHAWPWHVQPPQWWHVGSLQPAHAVPVLFACTAVCLRLSEALVCCVRFACFDRVSCLILLGMTPPPFEPGKITDRQRIEPGEPVVQALRDPALVLTVEWNADRSGFEPVNFVSSLPRDAAVRVLRYVADSIEADGSAPR